MRPELKPLYVIESKTPDHEWEPVSFWLGSRQEAVDKYQGYRVRRVKSRYEAWMIAAHHRHPDNHDLVYDPDILFLSQENCTIVEARSDDGWEPVCVVLDAIQAEKYRTEYGVDNLGEPMARTRTAMFDSGGLFVRK